MKEIKTFGERGAEKYSGLWALITLPEVHPAGLGQWALEAEGSEGYQIDLGGGAFRIPHRRGVSGLGTGQTPHLQTWGGARSPV